MGSANHQLKDTAGAGNVSNSCHHPRGMNTTSPGPSVPSHMGTCVCPGAETGEGCPLLCPLQSKSHWSFTDRGTARQAGTGRQAQAGRSRPSGAGISAQTHLLWRAGPRMEGSDLGKEWELRR